MSLGATRSQVRRKQKERMLRAVTCPHCWHHFDVSEIAWVSKHDELRGDPVLGSDDYIRFLPTRFNVDGDRGHRAIAGVVLL